jgi:hypothetical protein
MPASSRFLAHRRALRALVPVSPATSAFESVVQSERPFDDARGAGWIGPFATRFAGPVRHCHKQVCRLQGHRNVRGAFGVTSAASELSGSTVVLVTT